MVSAAPTQAQSELLEATVTVQLPDRGSRPSERRCDIFCSAVVIGWLLLNPPSRKRSRYLRYRCRPSIAILGR